MKVLLLESDTVIATNITKFFKKAGHKVITTADAQAAISLADNLKPDAVILDLLLCRRSGAEFLYELRSYPDWQKLPVIIYSSLPESDVPIEGSCFDQLDIAGFFYKPTSKVADLLETLNRSVTTFADATR